MFAVEPKKVFKQINRGTNGKGVMADVKDNKRFFWKIWSRKKERNRETKWLQVLERDQNKVNMRKLDITMEMVKERVEVYLIGRPEEMKVSRVLG